MSGRSGFLSDANVVKYCQFNGYLPSVEIKQKTHSHCKPKYVKYSTPKKLSGYAINLSNQEHSVEDIAKAFLTKFKKQEVQELTPEPTNIITTPGYTEVPAGVETETQTEVQTEVQELTPEPTNIITTPGYTEVPAGVETETQTEVQTEVQELTPEPTNIITTLGYTEVPAGVETETQTKVQTEVQELTPEPTNIITTPGYIEVPAGVETETQAQAIQEAQEAIAQAEIAIQEALALESKKSNEALEAAEMTKRTNRLIQEKIKTENKQFLKGLYGSKVASSSSIAKTIKDKLMAENRTPKLSSAKIVSYLNSVFALKEMPSTVEIEKFITDENP